MKKNIKYLFWLLPLIIVLLFYRCPTGYFLGIPCPFCGMTRAFLCVLRGDFLQAFYYHPLWPAVCIAGVMAFLVKFKILKISNLWIQIMASVAGLLFLSVFIFRHLEHSPVVEIDLTKGLLFRIFSGT